MCKQLVRMAFLAGLVCVIGPVVAVAQGPGRGPGGGGGPGRDPAMQADRTTFHYLLDHHDKITRSVTKLDNGVETVTESMDGEVTAKLQEHVAAMHRRVKEGRGLRFWDPLFVAIFREHAKVEMVVTPTEHGVRVTETSTDPRVVGLIQAHAEVVSRFVAHGFEEARREHAVP